MCKPPHKKTATMNFKQAFWLGDLMNFLRKVRKSSIAFDGKK